MKEKLAGLKRLLREARDLGFTNALLGWDQSTYMPSGGAPARSRQMALIAQLQQERAADPQIGRLLDALQPYAESLPYEEDDAALIRAARRDYERQVRIPPSFAAEFTAHQALTFQAWAEARPAGDFKRMRPLLEKTLDYSRALAGFFPGYNHIADPLINFTDYGLKAADVRRIFAELRAGLTPLIARVREQPIDDACIRRFFPREQQLKFSTEVARAFGYDFERGRLDLTHHPFTTAFSIGDVRITTRVQEHYLPDCLFSVFHEAGHALYEQGCNPAYEGTSLQGGASSGVHESQSRTWENIVGRSHAFWEYYYPRLQEEFPHQLKAVDLETFYRAVNKAEPSLIRTDADEVTYNLHPMIRFDLELALLEGSLAVKDLPEAWDERYESDLGITPPGPSSGVLQDVHWFNGPIGGVFQGYTLGNILSAMFYEKALAARPEIPAEIRAGRFGALLGWLGENIYQHGSKFTTLELAQRITGGGLDVQPLLRYLKGKYQEIYQLD